MQLEACIVDELVHFWCRKGVAVPRKITTRETYVMWGYVVRGHLGPILYSVDLWKLDVEWHEGCGRTDVAVVGKQGGPSICNVIKNSPAAPTSDIRQLATE